jgi:cytidylate kinase
VLCWMDETSPVNCARRRVTALASVVSAIPAVREWLLPVQRQIGAEEGCVVAEGRDIGTRVFPEADVKFFLEADAEVRATQTASSNWWRPVTRCTSIRRNAI